MARTIKIGIVVADSEEYNPILPYINKNGGKEYPLYGFSGHRFFKNGKTYHSLLCGNGKANAAAATAYLISEGADVIANVGLSGGIEGVNRGDLILGTEFTEHDFDLTIFGYGVAEKPGQGSIQYADKYLNSLFLEKYPEIKCGKFVSGDEFIGDDIKRKRLKSVFSANACDMESAAIASVCASAKVPFVSLRRISDDAGEGATSVYRQMLHLEESTLIDILMEILPNIDPTKI